MATHVEKIRQTQAYRILAKIALDRQPLSLQKALFTLAQTLHNTDTVDVIVRADKQVRSLFA